MVHDPNWIRNIPLMSQQRLLVRAPATAQRGRIGTLVMGDGLPARAWRSLRDEGLRSAWFRFLDTLGYRRLYVLRRSLDVPIPACPSRLPLCMEWLTPEGVDAYHSFRAGNDNAAMLLADGDRCLIARHGGRIVGALWGSNHRALDEHLDRDLPLALGEAFQYNTYTSAAERGQGVASALSAAWLRQMRAEGCTAALTLVLPENLAALMAYARASYEITAIVRTLRLGPWRYHWPAEPISAAGATPSGQSDVW